MNGIRVIKVFQTQEPQISEPLRSPYREHGGQNQDCECASFPPLSGVALYPRFGFELRV